MSSFTNWFSNLSAKIENLRTKIEENLTALKTSIVERLLDLRDRIVESLLELRDKIESGFTDLLENAVEMPTKIKEAFTEWFTNLIDGVLSIPEKIFEFIKSIFLPDEDFINTKVNYLKSEFTRLGVATYDMSAIMGSESPLEDITVEIMGQTVTIVRMDIVDQAIQKFRAVIRGFIALLLVMYNYDMFMGLIGQQGMQLGSMIQFRNRFGGKKDGDE